MQHSTPDLVKIDSWSGMNQYDGPFWFISGTAFHYMPTGDIYFDLTSNEEFNRISHIKQLGTVGFSGVAPCQDQDRGFHSLVTATMMDIVLFNNNFSEHDRFLGIAAGLYHDMAMFPCSDQGKLLKPKNNEEEDLISIILKKSSIIKKNLKKYGISSDELVSVIKGQGIIGSLLNSKTGIDIDNMSYLAIDQVWHPNSLYGDRYFAESYRRKGSFDQYNSLTYNDDKWVFENPKLVLDLVEFRSFMYQDIYHNPFNRAKEAFLSRIFKGHNVSLNNLLTWNDDGFKRWFEKEFGFDNFKSIFYIGQDSFKLDHKEYDLTQLDALKTEYENETTVVARLKPPRAALGNYVKHEGNIKSLEDIPEFQDKINAIKKRISEMDYVGVYSVNDIS